jgi:hypothetical protein
LDAVEDVFRRDSPLRMMLLQALRFLLDDVALLTSPNALFREAILFSGMGAVESWARHEWPDANRMARLVETIISLLVISVIGYSPGG